MSCLRKSKNTCPKVVVKVGSSVLAGGGTSIIAKNLSRVVSHIASLTQKDKDVLLVTSGAIACGLALLGLKKRPKDLPQLQAAAAIGQNILIQAYSREFERFGLKCGQILLTREDFNDRARYLNARNCLNTLLRFGVIPVINENDAVSVEEIKFGDNDRLSAYVAAAVEADGLLILTDIDGLYENFDQKSRAGRLKKLVEVITPEIEQAACDTNHDSCVGGMSTKIQAARIATESGIPVVLANGLKERLNIDFASSEGDGTLFLPKPAMGSKKHWMAFGAAAKGRIQVDEGARTALVRNFRSLLAPGIKKVEGIFSAGDIVEIIDARGEVFAKGKTGFSSGELEEVRGRKNQREVVHRDNLVILG